MNQQLRLDDTNHQEPPEPDSDGSTDSGSDWSTHEDLTHGGTCLLDTVAAVDFLRRGDRPGLTIWEALEEAIRWWTAERVALLAGGHDPEIADPPYGDDDPLRPTTTQLLAITAIDEPVHVSVALQQAIRRWAATMSTDYNQDQPWPHPLPRRTFDSPPPTAQSSRIIDSGDE